MQYTIEQSAPVSHQAAYSIREMILDGDLSDGGQINEVHLSSSLEISRTPVREGLQHLVAEGLVEIKPRRGFFVKLLTPKEFNDLYDMRPLLDPQALLMGGQPSDVLIKKVAAANKAFIKAGSGKAAVVADERFHRCLISNCQNAVLLNVIDNLMLRTRRYEIALFRETKPVNHATNEHQKIIKALEANRLNDAADLLRQNLTSGKETILDWLQNRN